MRKGCGTVVLAIVGVIIIGVVIAAATHKSNNGPTRSPALVTHSSPRTRAPAAAAAKPQTFKGVGSENIGTIDVPVQSTLHWSCASCAGVNFIINNSPTDSSLIDVNADGPASGETVVDSATYHDVSINTEGQAWTIKIVPGT